MEKILKIGWHLEKLWARVQWLLSADSGQWSGFGATLCSLVKYCSKNVAGN